MRKKLIMMVLAAALMTTQSLPCFAQETVATTTQVLQVKAPETTTKQSISLDMINLENNQYKYGFDISYDWDDAWFFQDPTIFNQELCQTAVVFSALATYNTPDDFNGNDRNVYTGTYQLAENKDDLSTVMSMDEAMAQVGLKDSEVYNLRKDHDDNELTQFNIGHKTVVNGEEEKELILLTIRGTRGEAEWLSNFNLGCDADYDSLEEWTEQVNHAGMDITTHRMLEIVKDYMTKHHITDQDLTFMITGHSRGGGIANLAGKKLQDEGYTTYTYTFAAPNTTVEAKNNEAYGSIFNIVNKEDFIPRIPAQAWGFEKYGVTKEMTLSPLLKLEWSKMVGKLYTSAITLNDAVKSVGEIMDNRNEAVVVKEGDKTSIHKVFCSAQKRQESIDSIPEQCRPYITLKLSEKKVLGVKTYSYTMYQAPQYFITAAGLNMAGVMSAQDFLTLEMAPKYKEAKTKLMVAALAQLFNAHSIEAYYLLAS